MGAISGMAARLCGYLEAAAVTADVEIRRLDPAERVAGSLRNWGCGSEAGGSWNEESDVLETLTRTVVVNGDSVRTRATTLARLLAELGYGDRKVATAVDGEFVPAARRAETTIAGGERVEIVAPRQGG